MLLCILILIHFSLAIQPEYVETIQFITQKTFPVHFTAFNSETQKEFVVSEISALSIHDQTFYAQSDGGTLYKGNIQVKCDSNEKLATLQEALEHGIQNRGNFSFIQSLNIQFEYNFNLSQLVPYDHLDAEGLAVLPNTIQRTIPGFEHNTSGTYFLVSSEPGHHSKSAINLFNLKNNKTVALLQNPAIQLPFIFSVPNMQPNKGIEAMCIVQQSNTQAEIVFGLEEHLLSDSATTTRIASFDYTTKKLSKVVGYPLTTTGAGISEIIAIDNVGLVDGGSFIVIERYFNHSTGNHAKLYQIFTEKATDITSISRIEDDLGDTVLVEKVELIDFAKVDGLQMDNFEALAIGPRIGNKLFLMVVTDDNENPSQIGSEFALFYLEIAPLKRLHVDQWPALQVGFMVMFVVGFFVLVYNYYQYQKDRKIEYSSFENT